MMRQQQQKPHPRVVLVGLSGPSGSGKSTVASSLCAALRSPLAPIALDLWMVPERMKPIVEKPEWGHNWETPEGIDAEGFVESLQRLKRELAGFAAQAAQARQTERKDVEWSDAPAATFTVQTPHVNTQTNLLRSPEKERLSASSSALSPSLAIPRPADAQTIFLVVEGYLLFYWPEVADLCDVKLFLATSQHVCRERRGARQTRHDPELFQARFDGFVWRHFEKYLPVQLVNMTRRGGLSSSSGSSILPGDEDPRLVAQKAIDAVDEQLLPCPSQRGSTSEPPSSPPEVGATASTGMVVRLPRVSAWADGGRVDEAPSALVLLPNVMAAFDNKV